MDAPGIDEFLARLSARDAGAAAVASRLLDAGWKIHRFVGPVQMDVWELILRSGPHRVRFGMERGYSDGVHIIDPTGAYRPLPPGVLPPAAG